MVKVIDDMATRRIKSEVRAINNSKEVIINYFKIFFDKEMSFQTQFII